MLKNTNKKAVPSEKKKKARYTVTKNDIVSTLSLFENLMKNLEYYKKYKYDISVGLVESNLKVLSKKLKNPKNYNRKFLSYSVVTVEASKEIAYQAESRYLKDESNSLIVHLEDIMEKLNYEMKIEDYVTLPKLSNKKSNKKKRRKKK